MAERKTETMKKALIEAVINGATAFALALGTLLIGRTSNIVNGSISIDYMLLLATGFGLVRFASYMYANQENVSPGETLKQVVPTTEQKGMTKVKHFCRTHQLGKLI